jgi:hypothetical protein
MATELLSAPRLGAAPSPVGDTQDEARVRAQAAQKRAADRIAALLKGRVPQSHDAAATATATGAQEPRQAGDPAATTVLMDEDSPDTGCNWDVYLEGEGYEERRIAELSKNRVAFLLSRGVAVSPPDEPTAPSPARPAAAFDGAALRAKGVYAGLSPATRLKKEQEMDKWRAEQFKRRDAERLEREEKRKAQEQERQAALLVAEASPPVPRPAL